MLHRISSASTRRPWLVIAVWAVLLIGGATVGQLKLYDVTTNDTAGFLPSSYESARAVKVGEQHFGVVKGATAVTALVKRADGKPLTASDRAQVVTLTDRMAAWRPDWSRIKHLVPLLTVVLVAGGANGAVVLAALAFGFHLDSSTPTLIETVLVGIGIDYFLFMTFRFRERLRTGESGREAAANAALRVAPVVASAALAIVAAFAALGLAHFGQFRVLGPSVAVAILVMLLAGVTLVPALLAAQGRKLFWPSKSWQREREDGPAARLGSLVARRPALVAIVAAGALASVAAFALGGRMNYDLSTTPKHTQAGRVQAEISRILPSGVTDE